MDLSDRIKNEIKRQRKIIEDSELIMDQVPPHLKQYQEIVLDYHRKELAIFEKMLKEEEEKENVEEVDNVEEMDSVEEVNVEETNTYREKDIRNQKGIEIGVKSKLEGKKFEYIRR